jgi:uncharacterized protein with PIN domain
MQVTSCGDPETRPLDDAASPRTREEPRFLANHMLGKLARWLRALGYDTEYDPTLDDPQLALKTARESRVLLTRDTGLVKRRLVRRWVLVRSGHLAKQLTQVVQELGLSKPVIRLRRCLVCNGAVRAVRKTDAVRLVPPYVAKTQQRFYRCASCGRLYWAGTHVQRMREKLREMLSRMS